MSAAVLGVWLVLASAAPERMVARTLVEHMAEVSTELKVGEWVTYKLAGGGERAAYWRIAVVGQEKDAQGRDAVWVEMDVGQHPKMAAPLGQMRMLVARGQSLGPGSISRMFVGYGSERPREVDPASLAARKGQASGRPGAAAPAMEGVRVTNGREQRLMTMAGTVLAVPVEVRYRATVIKRLWMSRQVPVLHLARLELPAIEHALEVRDYGLDARPMMVLPPPDAPKLILKTPELPFPEPGPQEAVP